MIEKFTVSISREGDWFIAQCLEVDVASQGKTKQEALDNLKEALELHFEEPQASVKPEIGSVEVKRGVA